MALTQRAVDDLCAARDGISPVADQTQLRKLLRSLTAFWSAWTEVSSNDRLVEAFNFRAFVFASISQLDLDTRVHAHVAKILGQLRDYDSGIDWYATIDEHLHTAMQTIIDIMGPFVETLSAPKVQKPFEHRFVSLMAFSWHLATGKYPTLSRNKGMGDKIKETHFQRFIRVAVGQPPIGSEVMRNAVEAARHGGKKGRISGARRQKKPQRNRPK
jgi:hypothetical protein